MNTTGVGSKILVVDDEENMRALLRHVLESEQYLVRNAGNGQAGLKMFFSWQPDLVILDIMMPRMNGWRLLERIREASVVPVIMLTAQDQEPEKVRALTVGADDYVVKPFGQQELLARVRAVLRRARKTTGADEVYDLGPHTAPDGTVTILFSDIEGFAHMTERLGGQGAQQVLREHNDIVRHQVAAHGGFEVKSLGDGFMVAFSSARRALQCSMAIQRAFAAHNESHVDEAVNVRIGLHTGELVHEMDDFFGKGVILASRIADQAQGGQILVSSLLKELIESTGDIQFGEGQEVELKGLAGLNRMYEVHW